MLQIIASPVAPVLCLFSLPIQTGICSSLPFRSKLVWRKINYPLPPHYIHHNYKPSEVVKGKILWEIVCVHSPTVTVEHSTDHRTKNKQRPFALAHLKALLK